MSGLLPRTGLVLGTDNASAEAALLAQFDFIAQRFAAGTSGAGTATPAELKASRDSFGLGAGDDVATATEMDLTGRNGTILRATGTVPTERILLGLGEMVWILALGAWPLVYHATDLPLNGGQSYTCTVGDWVLAIRDGSGQYSFTVIKKNETGMAPGAVMGFMTPSPPPGWLKANGAAVSRTTYSALFQAMNGAFTAQNFTVTIATPGVFSKASHGFTGGERMRLSTTGALPTGLNTSTDYFVLYLTSGTFQLSLTHGGAPIATSGSQSGTHSYLQSMAGLGDGSTTFNLPELRGEFPRFWDDGRGVDSGRALGTQQLDQMQKITGGFDIGGGSSGARFIGGSASGAFSRTTGGASGYLPPNVGWTSSDYTMGHNFDNANSPNARVSSSTSGETRSRSVAMLACIKY
ncbi:MAG: phage tail protein [Hylemonella sp.]|uniref:phage tail protein n=1 Tax=Hylemonella sp. TaxID=2066020 RepID=UPI00391A37E3